MSNELNLRRKMEVLIHYGNGKLACVKCGERELDCLSVDHVKGDGGGKSSRRVEYGYAWFIARNFPEGYQTLCMNCQFKKRVENNEVKGKKNPDITKRGRNTVVVATRVPTGIYTRIKALAEKQGMTISEWCKSNLFRAAGLLPDGGVRSHHKKR